MTGLCCVAATARDSNSVGKGLHQKPGGGCGGGAQAGSHRAHVAAEGVLVVASRLCQESVQAKIVLSSVPPPAWRRAGGPRGAGAGAQPEEDGEKRLGEYPGRPQLISPEFRDRKFFCLI